MAESSVFATLKGSRRIWAISAIHGEAERLAALHESLGGRLAPGDRLVYLGNYFGRGPAVRAALDELIGFRRRVIAASGMFAADVVFLRGCQEEMWHKILQLQFATNPAEVLDWTLRQGLGPTLAAYAGLANEGLAVTRQGAVAIGKWTQRLRGAMNQTPGHAEFMASLKRAAVTHDRRLLLVSAGIDPSRPLEAQDDALWWGGPGFTALEAPGAAPFDSYGMVVRGQPPGGRGESAAQPRIVHGAHTATVQSGAGFGGALLAACFQLDGEIVDTVSA